MRIHLLDGTSRDVEYDPSVVERLYQSHQDLLARNLQPHAFIVGVEAMPSVIAFIASRELFISPEKVTITTDFHDIKFLDLPVYRLPEGVHPWLATAVSGRMFEDVPQRLFPIR